MNIRELGYDTKYILSSLGIGFFFSIVIILLFVFALRLLPRIGITIKKPFVDIGSSGELFYRLLLRIPFGTAFFEENLFRGIFYGYLVRRYSTKRVFFITSLFFAIWHIVPAMEVVTSNFQITLHFAGIGLWLFLVIGAFLAGLFFTLLRFWGKSIIGCIIAHSLINDLALLVIYFLWK